MKKVNNNDCLIVNVDLRGCCLAILFCIVCTGCSTNHFTIETLNGLKMGMTSKQVESVAKVSPYKSKAVPGMKNYDCEMYSMVTAVETQTSNTGSYLTTTTTYFFNSCILLYHKGQLRYWGMMNDYSKSEDREIRFLSSDLYTVLYEK